MNIRQQANRIIVCAVMSGLVACAGTAGSRTALETSPVPSTTSYVSPSSRHAVPSASSTPSPAGEALNPEGPWMVLGADDALWIANPDGSGLRKIITYQYNIDSRYPFSAGNKRLAYIDDNGEWELLEIMIPELTVRKITPLITDRALELLQTQYPYTGQDDILPEADPGNLFLVFSQPGSLQWSHAGDVLAFTGALDGFSTDLYFYHPASGEIERMSSGPTQVVRISWSPDDRYVTYWGAAHLQLMNPNSTVLHSGGWVYDRQLRVNGSIIRGPETVRWVSNTGLLSYYSMDFCGNVNLTITDVQNAASWPANPFESVFGVADMDPKTGALMFSIPEPWTTEDMCSPWKIHPETGIFLSMGGNVMKLESITDREKDLEDIEIQWSPEADVFVISTYEQTVLVDTQGAVTAVIPVNGMKGIQWDADGQTMYFFKTDHTQDLYMASAPSFQPVNITDGIYFEYFVFGWVT
jgi:hypothetical protein